MAEDSERQKTKRIASLSDFPNQLGGEHILSDARADHVQPITYLCGFVPTWQTVDDADIVVRSR
jgi:hypothetical protein